MKTTTVVCDGCERDLTITTNCIGYRLVLKPEQIPSCGGVVTDMDDEPELKRSYHFCGVTCLSKWFADYLKS